MLNIYTNPLFYRHDTGLGHPETSDRLDAARRGVERAGLADRITTTLPRHAETARIIHKVHSADYDRELDEACRLGARLFHSLDNPISSGSHTAASEAVSLALHAADAIRTPGKDHRGFLIARPPGHHAERASAMGFCLFNTIACAAEYLLERPDVERLFIFDFDVHHGNGTQHLFESREDVFYGSIHRFPFYPGTGAASEIGVGAGRGTTCNIPLDAGAGDPVWLRQVEERIVPLIEDFRPQAILLSAGFDAHRRDPLGGMKLSEAAYGEITRRVVEVAGRVCEGRVLSLLEGGYDMEGLAASVAEHVTELEL